MKTSLRPLENELMALFSNYTTTFVVVIRSTVDMHS